jgi:8-amino-7-oxononanoate synthase
VAPLKDLAHINGIHLVVDEAHSAGLYGANGEGKVVEEGVEEKVFARLITFGKAFGVHGAAVVGSTVLKRYLINYARSFIYSTFSSDFNLVAIAAVYESVEEMRERRAKAFQLKTYFTKRIEEKELKCSFIPSYSLIQSFVVGENHACKDLEKILKQRGFAVKAIVSPTVPKGTERLRISLHSSNNELEIDELCEIIAENRKS